MWEFIKQKLTKLGCFFLIAMMMIAATAMTRVVLGWFHYDDARKETLSQQVGQYLGEGTLGLAFLLGCFVMGRQFIAGLRDKHRSPPPLPSVPPPYPADVQRNLDSISQNKSRNP